MNGGTAGNEELTARTGAVLILLLLVIGVTILWIGQLISVHLFVGLLLLGPVSLKLASTGYRFARYYLDDDAYRRKGPPELLLRLSAPVLVLTTALVFASGIGLLFLGPARRGSWVEIHKVSFIVWAVFFVFHLLWHIRHLPSAMRRTTLESGELSVGDGGSGSAGRWIALTGALVGGLVLALVLIPDFSVWTAAGALHHHHHG